MNGRDSRGGGKFRNACLTMHQPWASLLIHGIKRIEGRSWRSPITGRLWIHAASKVPEPDTIKAMENFYRSIYALDNVTELKFPEHYPVSRLLGCVEVVGCLKQEELEQWEDVPESVRSEALTDFCWLCENPQKLVVPFEMRGYQGVYNLENKIYEAARRGLTAIKGPLPVKFPLPDPLNSLSLKPGSLPLGNKASRVKKSESLSAAVAAARAAATQFSRKDDIKPAIREPKYETERKQDTPLDDRSIRTEFNLPTKRIHEDSEAIKSEMKSMSMVSGDFRSHQLGPRIVTINGSTKLFSDALKGAIGKH